MRHPSRGFRIDAVDSVDELSERLAAADRCLCSGFRFGAYLFLNDSDEGDPTPEYAVVKSPEEPDEPHLQIYTLRPASGDFRRAAALLRRLHDASRQRRGSPLGNLYLETPAAHGRCHLCA